MENIKDTINDTHCKRCGKLNPYNTCISCVEVEHHIDDYLKSPSGYLYILTKLLLRTLHPYFYPKTKLTIIAIIIITLLCQYH